MIRKLLITALFLPVIFSRPKTDLCQCRFAGMLFAAVPSNGERLVTITQAAQAEPCNIVGLNFYANALYFGNVTSVTNDGGVMTTYGTLTNRNGTDLEYSYFYIVQTAGVYIVHAAAPGFVYEASQYDGDVYIVAKVQ